MPEVVVAGGGISGCAAAAAAARAGCQVTLLERMELLGGCALFAGRVDHKYFPVFEELRLMGGDDMVRVFDDCTNHSNVKFPWPKPGAVKDLYDCTKLDPALTACLEKLGVEIQVETRATSVEMDGGRIRALVAGSKRFEGDAFVDATGGAGPVDACKKYGQGCAMCFWRCPTFGGRVSIAARAGVKEVLGKKEDGSLGPGTAAYSLIKESLAPEIKAKLEKDGIVWIPVPKEVVNYKRTENITATANIDGGFAENVVLVDIGGYAKRIAGGYTPMKELRRVPGLEHAIYADPYAGTAGNAVRYMAISPRDDTLAVPGVENLFAAGEKVSINGVGEAAATGVVAGYNAALRAAGKKTFVFPKKTSLGAFIAYGNAKWDQEEGLRLRTQIFAGGYLKMAEQTGLYSEDKAVLRKRIEDAGLVNVLSRKVA